MNCNANVELTAGSISITDWWISSAWADLATSHFIHPPPATLPQISPGRRLIGQLLWTGELREAKSLIKSLNTSVSVRETPSMLPPAFDWDLFHQAKVSGPLREWLLLMLFSHRLPLGRAVHQWPLISCEKVGVGGGLEWDINTRPSQAPSVVSESWKEMELSGPQHIVSIWYDGVLAGFFFFSILVIVVFPRLECHSLVRSVGVHNYSSSEL